MTELTQGRISIIQSAVYGVKIAIMDWYDFQPPLCKDHKAERGFNHIDCGRFLCPVGHNWEDEKYAVIV